MKFVRDINKLYKFGDVIGQGCHGIVREAVQIKTSTKVAIKILQKSGESHQEVFELLKSEMKVLGSLRHPNVISVHEFLQD